MDSQNNNSFMGCLIVVGIIFCAIFIAVAVSAVFVGEPARQFVDYKSEPIISDTGQLLPAKAGSLSLAVTPRP